MMGSHRGTVSEGSSSASSSTAAADELSRALEGGATGAEALGKWLHEAGLADRVKVEALVEEGIESLDDAAALDDSMLKELGVTKMGDRVKFRKLGEQMQARRQSVQVGGASAASAAGSSSAAAAGGVVVSNDNSTATSGDVTVAVRVESDDEEDDDADLSAIAYSLQDKTPSFQGFLKKRGDKGFMGKRAFLKRHFRLFDDQALLCYYKTDKAPKPIGKIHLRGVLVAEKTKGKGGFALTMKTRARVYDLQADKDELRDEWMAKIAKHLVDYGDAAAAKPPKSPEAEDDEAKDAKTAADRVVAKRGAINPVHRADSARIEAFSATLDEIAELPLSKTVRFEDPAIAQSASHALATKVGAAHLTVFSGCGSAVISEVRHVSLDDAMHTRINGLPRDAVSDSFSVRSLTEQDAQIADLLFRVDPKTAEELLLKSHGEGMKVKNSFRTPQGWDGETELEGTVQYHEGDEDKFVLAPSHGTAGAGTFHFLSTKDVVSYTPASPKVFDDAHLNVSFAKDSTKGAEHDVKISYEVDKKNFEWHAAYNCVLAHDEKSASFTGSIVVNNKSGISYGADTSLVFVSTPKEDDDEDDGEDGEKNQAEKVVEVAKPAFGGFGALAALAAGALGGDKPKEEKPRARTYVPALHASHALPKDRETQLVIADAAQLTVRSLDLITFKTPKFVSRPAKAPTHGLTSESAVGAVHSVVEFSNTKPATGANALSLGSMALPAGECRVVRKRADGAGVDRLAVAQIPHLDIGSNMKIVIDDLAGVTASRTQTGFVYDSSRDFVIESFEIKVINGRDEPITVVVQDEMYRWKHWEITSSNPEVKKHPNPMSTRTCRWELSILPGKFDKVVYTVFYNRFPEED